MANTPDYTRLTDRFPLTKTPLTGAVGDYGEFLPEQYFSLRYGTVASSNKLDLTMKPGKDNYHKLLEALGLDYHDPNILMRDWRLAEHAIEAEKRDYPRTTFVDPGEEPVCYELSLNHDRVTVRYFYDVRYPGLEQQVLEKLLKLREDLSEERKPVFRVLSFERNNFDTEEINIEPMEVDLARNYNDDFLEVDKVITTAIEEKTSGLILLHGIPGTGKTSYIKSLVSKYNEETFIFIPNDFVQQILQPSFITFLISQKDSILIIEDAEKVIMSRQDSGQNSVVSTILQITDGLFSDYLNIKVICTFNTDVSRIDKALFRKGRMIAFYEFGELTEEKARALVGEEGELPETRTLAELYNRDATNFKESVSERSIGFGR